MSSRARLHTLLYSLARSANPLCMRRHGTATDHFNLARSTPMLSSTRSLSTDRPIGLVAVMLLMAFAGWVTTGVALSATSSTLVTTESGQLRGTSRDGVSVYLGIPYAAPPVGQLRWRAPASVATWDGVRNATEYSASCPQALGTSTQLTPVGSTSEDCLYLNLWVPARLPAGSKAPVMVWVHGGGFIAGSGSEAIFDGTAYAKRGVVLVTINYRLGRLGFFSHPALTGEDPDGYLGNYGLLDVLVALKWVQRNIAAFGGDPGNVTLFGESAGGIITNALLTSPATEGLIHKAIVQSGAFLNPTRRMRGEAAGAPQSAEHAGKEFATRAGITADDAAAAAALRDLPVERVAPSAPQVPEIMEILGTAGPMIDGKLLRADIASAFARREHAKVPYLIGSTTLETHVWSFADDGSVQTIPITALDPQKLLASLGAQRESVLKVYRTQVGDNIGWLAAAIATDTGVGAGSLYLAQRMREAGPDAYVYRFSAVPKPLRGVIAGAPHGTDVPYTFDTLARLRNIGGRIPQDDHRIAVAILNYWTAFARTGQPKVAGQPEWPVYSASQRSVLEFTNDGPVKQTSGIPELFVRRFEEEVHTRTTTSRAQ
jgi:para-nitrobenzyl esterase